MGFFFLLFFFPVVFVAVLICCSLSSSNHAYQDMKEHNSKGEKAVEATQIFLNSIVRVVEWYLCLVGNLDMLLISL